MADINLIIYNAKINRLECELMPNVMAALSNIGCTLYSTPQSLADYYSGVQKGCQDAKPVEICLGCPKLTKRSQPLIGEAYDYCEDMWGRYCCLTSFSDCRYMP